MSLFLVKSGFLFLFFLVPLGFLAYKYGRTIAWTGFLVAVIGHAVFTLINTSLSTIPFADTKWDFLYFLLLSAVFIWIIVPPDGFSRQIPGVTRFIAGSTIGALLLTFVLFRVMTGKAFMEYMDSWIRMFISVNNPDAVQTAILEGLTVEGLLSSVQGIMLRGGSLIICVFMFFISRQASIILVRLTAGINFRGNVGEKRINTPEKGSRSLNTLLMFHVNPQVIWVFSASLFLVVLTRIFRFEIPEIILWNILILCVMMYLAQGMGILQFFLTKPRTSVFPKLMLGALFIVLLVSPIINVVLFGGLILLGIAENWVPFRAPKKNGPPSTPEAGDGGS